MLRAILKRLEVAKTRDNGLTLIELLIVMFLTGIVSTIVLFSMKGVYAGQRTADSEATGMSDVRTVDERLGRDLRDAREVYQGATASQLVLWIDNNSDYKPESDEIVTWQLQSAGCSGCHYQVLRSEAGGQVTEARTLVSALAFCYSANVNTDPPSCLSTPLSAADAATAKVVTVTVTYNAASSSATDHRTRTTTFTERLRNVA